MINRRSDFFPGSIQAPDWCARVLRKFGVNLYGENIFRMAFLPSRCYVVGGYWESDGALEYRLCPRYSVREQKWALERFVPAAWLGSPESWDKLASTVEGYYAIGPYPAHGLFEVCHVFSEGRGIAGYVPLEPGSVELAARLIWMGKSLTRYAVRAAALGEEEEKIRKQDEYFEKLLADKSYSRNVATYGMAATYNREHLIEDYKTRIRKSKAWSRKHRFVDKGFGQTGELPN